MLFLLLVLEILAFSSVTKQRLQHAFTSRGVLTAIQSSVSPSTVAFALLSTTKQAPHNP